MSEAPLYRNVLHPEPHLGERVKGVESGVWVKVVGSWVRVRVKGMGSGVL